MDDEALNLEHFIALDKRYIRLLLPAGLFLVLIGLLGLFGDLSRFFASSSSNAIDMIVKGFGSLVTAISLFPFNNCYSRWERIQTLRTIERNPEALDYKSKHELVCRLYAKFLGV